MKNVRQRGNTLEIYLTLNGKKKFIKVNDLNQAKQIQQQINTLKQTNQLTEETLQQLIKPTTFKDVMIKYLKYNQANKQTKTTYENILNHHWIDLMDIPIKSIDLVMILDLISEKDLSDKYINQILIPLRGVFDTAVMLKLIDNNPINIKNRKLQSKIPDPFTIDEMETILDWLANNKPKVYYLFYEISFWTGLRPSELLALTRQDIVGDKIYVDKTRLNGLVKPYTKTKTSRVVLMNKRSQQAIQQLQTKEYLMINPETNQPFYNNKPLRIAFNQALEVNGIRKRPSYNTRHTYATMLLMKGVTPAFVANQLGHSLVMLLSRYARWINSDKDKKEIEKLNL